MADVRRLLATERIVTLTGAPGMGKTRLAAELARQMAPDYPGGVWMAPLAPVSAPHLVTGAVSAVVPGVDQSGRSGSENLAARMGPEPALLVLDNCEHVVASCAELVAALVAAAPALTVLATSQEPLNVEGERVWPVSPMAIGDDPESPALRLFADRARAVRPEFELLPDVVPAVAKVCRRLDGIPLAIELAAARITMFTPEEIRHRLDDRFTFLTQGARTAVPRHQTLKAAVDWSYQLLAPQEQALLRRMSVFSGSATLEAIEWVCATVPGELHYVQPDDFEPELSLELLTRLVTKSLVDVDQHRPETRFRLLETIRHYGLDRLCALAEAPGISDRHAQWCAYLAERSEALLTGEGQGECLALLDAEHDNLRASLRWSIDRSDPVTALRIAGALTLFWRTHGHFGEGRRWLDEALNLATSTSVPEPLLAKATWGRGLLAAMVGDYDAARADGEASLALWNELDDLRGGARALLLIGTCALITEAVGSNLTVLQQAIALARQVGDSWCLAHGLALCGSHFNEQGDAAAARPVLEECVHVARSAGDEQCLAFGLNGLGYVDLCQGDYLSACKHLEEALLRARSTGGSYETASVLTDLACVALGQGHLERARSLLAEAFSVARATGSSDSMVYALETSGRLAMAHGDLDAAEQMFRQSVDLATELRGTSVPALRGLGEVALATGNSASAERLATEALELARDSGHKARTADALHTLANVARARSDGVRAAALHRQALAIRVDIGDQSGLAASLEALAGLVSAEGHAEQGPQVLGAAETLRDAFGYARSPSDEAYHKADTERLQTELGERYAKLWREGRSMPLAEAVSRLSKNRGARSGRPVAGWESLTHTEREVATLAAHGLTNIEIGERLFVSANTVKTHLSHVFGKLHVSSRRELTRRLVQESP